MWNKLFLLIAAIAVITLFFGFLLAPAPPDPKVYNLKVVNVKGVWRVVDASDYSKRKIKVKKKDTIIWTVEGTNAHFQFATSVFKPKGVSDSLKNGSTKYIADGKKLRLKVRNDAPIGPQVYAVFCSADDVFAQGESPPQIIID